MPEKNNSYPMKSEKSFGIPIDSIGRQKSNSPGFYLPVLNKENFPEKEVVVNKLIRFLKFEIKD